MSLVAASFRNIKLIYTLWWMVWMWLHAAIVHRLGYDWRIAFYDSLISNVLLILVCLAIGNIIRYYQPSKTTAWKLIVWCFLAALFWVWLSQWIITQVVFENADYLLNLSKTLPIRFAIGFLTLGCTLLIVWVWEFVVFKNEDATRQANSMALAKEAELAGLNQQLQPHFLFNSLNSINALIGTKPQEARKMVQQLSDFLRGTLKKDTKQLVKLEDELNHLQLYLDIEKVRFGHRLKTVFETTDEALEYLVPQLILQPIVENAIKFGLYDTTGEVEIKIKAIVEKSTLKITIQNPFDAQTSVVKKGTGFGLKSVSRRLYLLYARNDLLETHSDKNLFTTTLIIPQNL